MNAKDLIVVAGSGRSGTTWLGNIIAGDEFKVLFEPFDCRKLPVISELGLRPYFRVNDEYPEWHDIIAKIMSGEYKHELLKNDNSELKTECMRGILIKDIRVNGILKWLQSNFNIKLLFIVRHPCAVAVSRIQCKWKPEITSFLNNKQLIEDLDVDVIFLNTLLKSELYSHVIMWCFENAVPVRQFGKTLPLFRYEHLVINKENCVQAMLRNLELTFDSVRMQAFSELSSMSTRKEISQDDFLNGWRRYVSDSEIEVISKIISHFQLSSLYEIG